MAAVILAGPADADANWKRGLKQIELGVIAVTNALMMVRG
jgi:hypothetical protein